MIKLTFRYTIGVFLCLEIMSFSAYGQKCTGISGAKDKKKGTITYSGITNSKDFYSLMISKVVSSSDTIGYPKYILTLHAATKVLLSDSLLKTKGTFDLKLLDNSNLTIDSVTFLNNPLGYCCSLGFQCEVDEEVIKIISRNPIVTITVKDILSSSFVPKKQEEQQTICTCLLNR